MPNYSYSPVPTDNNSAPSSIPGMDTSDKFNKKRDVCMGL